MNDNQEFSEEYVNWFNAPFSAIVTGVQLGTGNYSGIYLYTWAEMLFNPDTGIYSNMNGGRSGKPSLQPLVELNNLLIEEFPFIARVWFKGYINGSHNFEFQGDCCSESTELITITSNICPLTSDIDMGEIDG